jgi:hypothetical protein
LALIWLSFLVVVGSGGSFVATAAPQARGVNARLVSGVTLPYGSQSSHLFADWYHFPDLDTTTAKTKWGKHALGVKTRRRKLASDQFIITRRKGKSL